MKLILALILSMQYDWADGASGTREISFPNLVKNSPSLPPYKDVIGPAASPASDALTPPPPYCMMFPPPARPTLPAPLPPASSPSAPPSPSVAPSTPPSIAPGGDSPPPAFRPPVAFPSSPPPRDARPGLWCVANPTAATAMLQPAMDYACGSGADCDMTAPGGPCHLPDTLMVHASYAFNSYWQRTKVAGATCDFAGAAVLVTKDPSYDGCHYVYL
ncbi:hypothetical protein QOZ80_6BG0501120 [Eleusine coracana subsp. coracana]|nr:hypothetical protein QOZ80_6BG0501120 [Eleusine coracana subsp. coracana]